MLTREIVIEKFATKIRNLMDKVLVECLQEVKFGIKNRENDESRFDILKQLSQLTSELLDDDKIEKKIIELANESTVNCDDNKIKMQIFGVLRNIISHFPFFEKYDDIILSKELLTWNNPSNPSILNFFEKHDKKTIKCKIYYKDYDECYKEIKVVTLNIKKIADKEEIKLCNIISLNDAIWMFSIIDYYIDYLGLKIEPQYGLSI